MGTGLETKTASSIFHKMGTRPLINACGVYTDLGGSVLSPTVWEAMEDANRSFVGMVDLLEQSGRVLARLMGAEAARVTTGASAAIALATAACMTGMEGPRWEQLPDTSGMKNEVLMQRLHRYKYDRCARLTGARIVEAGSSTATTRDQFAAALGPQTAVVLYPAHLESRPGSLPLRDVIEIAHARNVPVLVDAAYLNYPISLMRSFTATGADLVCFSSKYFSGPNSTGFVCGRADLMQAVAGVDFTRYESGKYLSFGRPFKLDRQMIVATVVALEEWLAMDHDARWRSYRARVEVISRAASSVPGITLAPQCFTMDERLVPDPVNCLALRFAPGSAHSAQSVCDALAAGDPSVATVVLTDAAGDALVIAVDTVLDGQEHVIAERLRRALGA